MSLFQCEHCGCIENTAVSCQGIGDIEFFQSLFDWTGIEDRRGKLLCSACAPSKFKGGEDSEMGQWHGQFPRRYLPLGQYQTGRDGNLVHRETGAPPPRPDAEIRVGDRVNYHAMVGGPVTSTDHTVLDFYRLGHGERVAKISDKSGCVALDALSLANSEVPS